MAAWRLAKSLELLRTQVNTALPHRSKTDDGSIGDAAHASRSSDHNPWVKYQGMGIVTAIDITHDPKGGFNSYTFADHLREMKDPRVKYIISNRRISNPMIAGGSWRPYQGSNPHDHHVHISVSEIPHLFDDMTPWNIDAPIPVVLSTSSRPLLVQGTTGEDVKYLQRMLGLSDTGVFDEFTKLAVMAFQKKYDLIADGRVGGYTWRQLEA